MTETLTLKVSVDELLARLNMWQETMWKHQCNAESLLSAAADPCNGEHECQDDHEGEDCDCDLECTCDDPDTCRAEAAVHAQLAQSAATMANTAALMLQYAAKPAA